MKSEWMYVFKSGPDAERFLASFAEEKRAGNFLGSTYSKGWSHSCFNLNQRFRTETLIAKSGVQYQCIEFVRGNILDDEHNIKTFKQPFVQWCPSPIYSGKFNQIISDDDAWGLTMEGDVAIDKKLEGVIGAVNGLDIVSGISNSKFNIYKITNSIKLFNKPIDENSVIEIIHADALLFDIMKIPECNAIICSNRLAKSLKKSWNGLVYAKFQPVLCQGVAEIDAQKIEPRSSVHLSLPPPKADGRM